MEWLEEATEQSAATRREEAVALGEVVRIWLASVQHYKRSRWTAGGRRSSGCELLETDVAAV